MVEALLHLAYPVAPDPQVIEHRPGLAWLHGEAAQALYPAPALIVQTRLQTEPVQGNRHHAQGERIGANGQTLLVGVATVEPTGEAWFDRFLGLPEEALALMRCRFCQASASAA